MEWLAQLNNKIVGLDTSPLIYFIEQNPTYLNTVRAFFQGMNKGDFQVVTSTLTLTEVLVHPLKMNNIYLATQYQNIILREKNMITLSVTPEIAALAARLRATKNLRTPDAIQIASAIEGGAKFFLTNDIRLSVIQDINILILDEIINL